MVFSSIPIYLDPPNWQQEHNQQPAGATGGSSQLLLPPPQPPQAGGCSGAASSIRPPGSMTERARLAKIPQPEPGLKCPRCDSTNTKFCYFNNYSLSQPRHFCKACRRYWTRGGALRNVPVGGGCRRNNKRSKGAIPRRSKSPVVSREPHAAEQYSLPDGQSDIFSQIPAGASALPLLPPLNHLGEYNSGESALTLGGVQASVAGITGFQVGSSSSGLLEQFRSLQQLHQFPFLTSFGVAPAPIGVYSFDGEGVQPVSCGGPVRFKAVEGGLAPAATGNGEENIQGINLSKHFTGVSVSAAGNEHFWSGNSNNSGWTDLSGFSNSSTSNHL